MYSREIVREYYDSFGEGEWNRLNASAHARLIFHLHTHFLRNHIGSGKDVLDAGCGAGRFAIHLAESGSTVTLLDISEVQLAIAKDKLYEADFDLGESQFVLTDICDLSMVPDNTFDTTVCYGGTLNYLFNRLDLAIGELIRVTKPGGAVLASVMSRWGCLRFTIAREKLDPGTFFARPEYWQIYQIADDGNLMSHPDVPHPPRHFFTSDELRTRFEASGLESITLGAAPSISSALYSRLDQIATDETAWQVILNLEERAYCREGLADAGEFLLISGVKPGAN